MKILTDAAFAIVLAAALGSIFMLDEQDVDLSDSSFTRKSNSILDASPNDDRFHNAQPRSEDVSTSEGTLSEIPARPVASTMSSSPKAMKQPKAETLASGKATVPSSPPLAKVVVEVESLYAARTREDRSDWIADLGGTKESEQAVNDGLDWLARHQAESGHWSDQSRCDGTACSTLNFDAPTAQTGLAILAFQAGGHYAFNSRKYSEIVQRGLDWLVSRQKPDGSLFDRHTWYEHGIATFALAEACAVALTEQQTPDVRYMKAARLAVSFMEKHQYERGGWQYALDSRGEGDSSVTGWQLLALKSANEADIDVENETMDRVLQFFQLLGDPQTGYTRYQSRSSHTDLTTAVGLIVQQFFMDGVASPLALKAADHLKNQAGRLGNSNDFYTLYNATLAMFLTGGDSWTKWNTSVRDAVIKQQQTSGCQRGSWEGRFGRTLSTTWAVLTLEVYYRYARDETGWSNRAKYTNLSPEFLKMSLDQLQKELQSSEVNKRWTAAAVLGRRKNRSRNRDAAIIILIDALDDMDTDVLQEARRGLVRLTDGIDHGPPKDATEDERTKAKAEWVEWRLTKLDLRAAGKFNLAKSLYDTGNKNAARDWMAEIVRDYAGTNTAREAQAFIKVIDGVPQLPDC